MLLTIQYVAMGIDKQCIDLQFEWISRSRAGITGNDRAVNLAKVSRINNALSMSFRSLFCYKRCTNMLHRVDADNGGEVSRSGRPVNPAS